jgi:hypothetical protein
VQVKQHVLLAVFILPIVAWAQLTLSPITTNKPDPHLNSRTQSLSPMPVPFWDDFSSLTNSDTLWEYKSTVWINDGLGIRPPTISVATFDGLDANGIPYSPSANQNLDFGLTDSLVSRKIKMGDIPLFQRNSVFLSFFYQWGGNGEVPDANDFLRLEFLSNTGIWTTIVTLFADESQTPDQFYSQSIRINEDQFFHNDFQFRFRSSGRRSGRYDTWNIDYIYLNRGRTENDLASGFPDRAPNLPLTALFNRYYAMPHDHYFADADGNTGFASFGVSNLSSIPQPMNYAIGALVTSYTNGIRNDQSFTSATEQPILPTVGPFETREVTFTAKPNLASFSTTDSLWLTIRTTLVTGDSVNTGFEPIDFYMNDTIQQTYILKDFYSYDDGTAEYAVGLTQTGNMAAYRYVLKSSDFDTLNGVYVHYPYTSGSSPTNVRFKVWDNKNGLPDQLILDELIPVQRKSNSEFIVRALTQSLLVKDTIYIGWQQPAAERVQIGLDASQDSGDQIFVNITGNWVPNTSIQGSLMLRPRFGKGNIITGIEHDPKPLTVYPNPNHGEFTVQGEFNDLQIVSITGQSIPYTLSGSNNESIIRIMNPSPGVYILRYYHAGKPMTNKVIVSR